MLDPIIKANTELELQKFQPVSLQELDTLGYGDRLDTKFAFRAEYLPLILEKLQGSYKALDIENHRFFSYESIYYDTEFLRTYIMHHNRAGHREKVRIRKYVDTNTTFLEVKKKNNKGRTIKSRIKSEGVNGNGFLPNIIKYLRAKLSMDPELLLPSLKVTYNRIALADTEHDERVTIDLNLNFTNLRSMKSKGYPEVAIAEVKQVGYNRLSPIMEFMHTHGVHTINLSKYCLGIVSCYEGVKYNRFKKKILRMEKISSEKNTILEYNGSIH